MSEPITVAKGKALVDPNPPPLIGDSDGDHYYSRSPEIRELYGRLYPDGNFDAFCNPEQLSNPRSLEIHQEYGESALIELGEPDFKFRQLIWFFRPIPNCYAFTESLLKWEFIAQATKQYDSKKQIPWDSLLRTAKTCLDNIKTYRAEHHGEVNILFDGYAIRPENLAHSPLSGSMGSGDHEDAKGFVNPLLHKGVSNNPLNAIILNDPSQEGVSPTMRREQESEYARLAGYILIRESERRIPTNSSAGNGKAEKSIDENERQFADPYQFLNCSINFLPGRSKLTQIDRIDREWSRQWEDAFMPATMKALLQKKSYGQFIEGCKHQLFLMSKKESLAQKKLVQLLQFFAYPRITHRGGGGGPRSSGTTLKQRNKGRHYWQELAKVSEYEETLYGHEVEVIDVLSELTDEEIDQFEDAGEDPSEEEQDRPRFKVLFGEDVRAAKLELDQHVRYQQRLIASLNQQLHWDGGACTRAEMDEFMSFLKTERQLPESNLLTFKASLTLEVLILLGVDLDMALSIEIGPEQNEKWLEGNERFMIGSVVDKVGPQVSKKQRVPLRICQASYKDKLLPIWVYPIPVRSLKEHANIQRSAHYQQHSATVAFADQSGLIKELLKLSRKLRVSRKSTSTNTELPIAKLMPLFTESEKSPIKYECIALLKKFNSEKNDVEISQDTTGLFQAEGKRMVSFGKIRQFSRGALISSGVEIIFVDMLDWSSPKSQAAALFYYTHDAYKKAQAAKPNTWTGLQYTLSDRTGLFTKNKGKFLPSTKRLIFGATGLLKPEAVAQFILQLQEELKPRSLVINNRAQWDTFRVWMNTYSLYMALWYCCETSHRPHHIPYGDIKAIDPIYGLTILQDKTGLLGDKNRIAKVSNKLQEAMRNYAQIAGIVEQWAIKNQISYAAGTLLYIEESPILARGRELKKKKEFSVIPMSSTIFTTLLKKRLAVESNFFRKLISFLLRQDPPPPSDAKSRQKKSSLEAIWVDTKVVALSQTDVQIWLSHWNHGTAPFHQFGTTCLVEHAKRIEEKLQEVIGSLGFTPVPVKPLSLTWSPAPTSDLAPRLSSRKRTL